LKSLLASARDVIRMSLAWRGHMMSLLVGWLTMFVIGTDLFVISPLLPKLAEQYGVSPALVGLSVTAFSLSYIISAPLSGHVADQFGQSRVLTVGLIVFAAGNLATAAASGLFWLLAARLVAGAGAAAVSPTVYTLVASAAAPERRASWMAFIVSGVLVSLALGAPIGGWLGAALGWRNVFIALAAASLFVVLPNRWVWPRRLGVLPGVPRSLVALSAVTIARRITPMVLWSTGLYGMYTYLGVGLAAAGHSTENIARAIMMYGAGAIAGVLLGGQLTDRFGTKRMSAIALLGLSVCFVLLQLAVHAGVLVWLVLGITSVVAQLFFPAQQTGLANDFPQQRTSMMAWNNSALFFGISLGSLFGGQTFALAGFGADLMLAAALSLVAAMIVLLFVPTAAGLEAEVSGIGGRTQR
jgi:predicted MFS family arabinose efflux permease